MLARSLTEADLPAEIALLAQLRTYYYPPANPAESALVLDLLI